MPSPLLACAGRGSLWRLPGAESSEMEIGDAADDAVDESGDACAAGMSVLALLQPGDPANDNSFCFFVGGCEVER